VAVFGHVTWGPGTVFGLGLPSGSNVGWSGIEGNLEVEGRAASGTSWSRKRQRCEVPMGRRDVNAARRAIGGDAGGSTSAQLAAACGCRNHHRPHVCLRSERGQPIAQRGRCGAVHRPSQGFWSQASKPGEQMKGEESQATCCRWQKRERGLRRRNASGVEAGDVHSAIRKTASRKRGAVQMVDGL
jgi:hypothetical protein